MIRVAVILAAIALAPWLGLSTEAQAQQAPKRVSDAYYAKRAQAKLEAAAGVQALADGVENLGPDGQNIGAHPVSSSRISRQGPLDPYYAARQAAAAGQVTPVDMFDASSQPGEYLDGAEEIRAPVGETVQAPDQILPGNLSGPSSGPAGDYSIHPGAGLVDNYNEFIDSGPGEPSSILWDEIHSCRTYWASAEYLAWGFKGNHVPALVTTSPNGTPQAAAGVLGQPNTHILFGDDRILTGVRSGGRITAGAWIVGDIVGIEANYFGFGTQTTNFNAQGNFSNGGTGPILAVPLTNAVTGNPDSIHVAFPDFVTPSGAHANLDGVIRDHAVSNLQSAGVDLKRMVAIDFLQDRRMFLIGGYRFLELNESLNLSERITEKFIAVPTTRVVTGFDQFATKNQFHGGDIGLSSDFRRGPWVLESQARVALGNMHQTIDVYGNQSVTEGSVTKVFSGGVFAQKSNSGHFTRNQFAAIPEFNFKLGLQLSCNWRATVGYNFSWISRVAQPGNQIDTLVSVPPTPGGAQLPPASPVYLNNPTSIWMQGITTGLEYRF